MWEPKLWSALFCPQQWWLRQSILLLFLTRSRSCVRGPCCWLILSKHLFSELHKCHPHRLKNPGEKNCKDTGHVINSVSTGAGCSGPWPSGGSLGFHGWATQIWHETSFVCLSWINGRCFSVCLFVQFSPPPSFQRTMRAAFLHFMKMYTDFSAKQLFTCISVRQESAFHWIKAVRNGNKDL